MRLKRVMGDIIDERQSTFIGERNNLDRVLIANEIVHEAKVKKEGFIVFKADFEKAYYSVKWDFLTYMLHRIRFCRK